MTTSWQLQSVCLTVVDNLVGNLVDNSFRVGDFCVQRRQGITLSFNVEITKYHMNELSTRFPTRLSTSCELVVN